MLQYLPENWEEYAGRTAQPLVPKDTTVTLDAPGHVYDAREGRAPYVDQAEVSGEGQAVVFEGDVAYVPE